MQSHRLRLLAVIVGATVFMDWILGALCASGALSLWVYFLANIPLGGIYVWMESSWVGTHYVMLGRHVGDLTSLAIWFLAALLQGCLYAWVWMRLRRGMSDRPHRSRPFGSWKPVA